MNKDSDFDFLDAIGDVYANARAQFPPEYNRHVKQYKQKDRFQEKMNVRMKVARYGTSFATNIDQEVDMLRRDTCLRPLRPSLTASGALLSEISPKKPCQIHEF